MSNGLEDGTFKELRGCPFITRVNRAQPTKTIMPIPNSGKTHPNPHPIIIGTMPTTLLE